MRRALFAQILGLVLVLAVWAPTAFGHAYLERADPPPGATLTSVPAQLRLTFGEPMDPAFSRVQLLDANRQQADRGDSRVLPDNPFVLTVTPRADLPDGLYTVAWRTLSTVDGHDANGAYQLIIGELADPALGVAPPTSQAGLSWATGLARWWLYLAGGGLFGVLLAWRVVFAPVLSGRGAPALGPTRASARKLAIAFAIALVLGVLYGAVAQAATSADVSLWTALGSPVRDVLGGGRFATIWWPRFLLSVAALACVWWRGVDGRGGTAAFVLTPLVLLTSSLTSHGAALVSGAYLAIAADWVHFVAAAAWTGGLASLVALGPGAVAESGRGNEAVRGRLLRRFSTLALASVLAIVATGLFQSWLQVGSLTALLGTAYGQAVLAKAALMGGMLLLGAMHLGASHPALAERLLPRGVRARLVPHAGRALQAELALGIVVLTIAAVLTGTPPGREELARRSGEAALAGPIDRQLDAQGVPVRLRITPNAVGVNRFTADLPSTDPRTVERVQLTLTFLDQELGSQNLVLEPPSEGSTTWHLDAPALSQAGAWQAELLVRRGAQDDARTALRFVVTGPGPAASSVTQTAVYPLLPSPLVVIAYTLILCGLALVTAGLRRRASPLRRLRQGQAALLAGGALVMLAGGYVYAQEQRSGMPLDIANVRSPIPGDAASLARGQAIYTEAGCAACHGDTGRGDGPAGLRLVPRPADFRVHMAAGHMDGQLFYWVGYGVPGTAMPAFRDTLSEEDRWHVINYIRTFANR